MADESILADVRNQTKGVTASSSAASDPVIFFSGGGKTFVPSVPGEIPGRMTTSRNVTKTASQIQQEILAAAARRDPNYGAWAQLLLQGGFTSDSRVKIPLYVANDAMNAIQMYQAHSAQGGKGSFQDWIIGYVQSAPQEASTGSGGMGGGYSGPVTTTSVNITDEDTAEALLDKYARDLLGRGLTEKERTKYIKEFNLAEEQAPQVTVSGGSGATRTSTTTTATSKEELLRQVVSKNPDYAKFQVDTTIMDMLMDDIRKGQEVIRG
jgi:hypothetical protein